MNQPLSNLIDPIDQIFGDEQTPRDQSGSLVGALQLFSPLEPTLLFVANGTGSVLAVHQVSSRVPADWADVLAAQLAHSLGRGDFLATRMRSPDGTPVCVIGVRTCDHEGVGGMLGAVVDRLPADEAETGMLQRVVANGANSAWRVICSMHELRLAEARVQQLRAEKTALQQAHARIVAENLRDRERALREREEHILHLERDFAKRARALQEAVARAEQASAAKSEFLTRMSHEIRTPMTAILGFADLLANPNTEPCELPSHVAVIQRNGKHLLELINDMLDLTRVESAIMEPESEQCIPEELIREVVELLRPVASEKNVELRIAYLNPIPRSMHTDPTYLRQALLNLMGNAVKFTREGTVTLQIQMEQGHPAPQLRIEVIDTGIGIPADRLDTIFEPFRQVERFTGGKLGGTGLGLTITQRIAEVLGGSLTVVSELGRGSSFTLRVPTGSLEGIKLVDQTQLGGDNHPHTRIARNATPIARYRILLVEDDPDHQRLVAFMLTAAGCTVELAADGQAGTTQALAAEKESNPFDVVLMDVHMPVMGGYQAVQVLRANGYSRPIIALTAHAMTSERAKCLEAGCNAFISKPVSADELLSAIAAAATSPRPVKSVSAQKSDIVPVKSTSSPGNAHQALEAFIAGLPLRLEAIQHALRAHDLAQLSRIVAEIRSAAQNRGLDDISAAAASLEQTATRQIDMLALADQFKSFLSLCRRSGASLPLD